MNSKILALSLGTAMAWCAMSTVASAQNEILPVIDPNQLQQLNDSAAVKNLPRPAINSQSIGLTGAPTLPTWSYSVVAHDGFTYTGQIVGRSPFLRGKTTTTVNVVLIPLRITINQGTGSYVLDPTGADNGCLGAGHTALNLTQQSPVFSPAPISMGGTFIGNVTHPDAHLRGSFWSAIGASANSAYHLGLALTTAPVQSVSYTVPSGGDSTATVYSFAGCGTNVSNPNIGGALGVVDINSIDTQLQAIITSLGLNASQFPLFLTYSTVISNGPANSLGNCCILGYHSAFGGPGSQTYGIAEYDKGGVFLGVEDISVLTHEVSEWLFDPYVNNATPLWGGIGQVAGCQGNLEVGDPLSGTLSPGIPMPNGVTYHPQEMAFFSWFFTPTTYGVNNKFSTDSTFAGNAKSCPPGGTN